MTGTFVSARAWITAGNGSRTSPEKLNPAALRQHLKLSIVASSALLTENRVDNVVRGIQGCVEIIYEGNSEILKLLGKTLGPVLVVVNGWRVGFCGRGQVNETRGTHANRARNLEPLNPRQQDIFDDSMLIPGTVHSCSSLDRKSLASNHNETGVWRRRGHHPLDHTQDRTHERRLLSMGISHPPLFPGPQATRIRGPFSRGWTLNTWWWGC